MRTLTRDELHRWKAEGRDAALVNVPTPEAFHARHVHGRMRVVDVPPLVVAFRDHDGMHAAGPSVAGCWSESSGRAIGRGK